jgi:hypothetical protein
VAPEEEVEDDSASSSKHDVPGAEHAISGGIIIGGQSSGVGASGGSTEPTAASTETEETFLVGASSAAAVQAVAEAKGNSDLGDGGSSVQMSQRRRSRVARIRRRAFWVWLLKTKQNKMQQAVRRMTYQALSTRVAAG